ncbi:MAG: heat-inducible transcription repressor HrcA [Gemmatimonadetes bacterium]|nr:heat-inducible transcription repressor HrcA [Gemmatimonadota bacterium]
MNERRRRVLHIIVDDYVATAAPVASAAVARYRGLRVSPATVRNDMAALEEDGYIIRPHSVAGSVPSDKGYRRFVEDLPRGTRPRRADAATLQRELADVREDVDAWRDAAASVVATLLGALVFVTSPRARAPTVRQIELVYLQELLIMLVLVLREAAVHRQLFTLTSPTTPESVAQTGEKLSSVLAGKTAHEIERQRHRMRGELEAEAIRSTLAVLRQQEAKWVRGRAVQGLANLFGQPEFASAPARARSVLSAVEDDESVATISRAAPDDGTAAAIIGGENAQASLQDCGVVVCRYGVPGEAQGIVGLIGPTRMSYRRALPVVRQAASMLSGFVSRLYGTEPYTAYAATPGALLREPRPYN